MPNYDLGTAHGRIKIDVDDRGAIQAERTVSSLEKTMQSLDRRMAGMQSSMLRIEAELGKLSNEFKRANDEADKLEASMGGLGDSFGHAGGAARAFSGDLRGVTQQAMQLARVARTVVPPLTMLRNTLRGMNNSRFSGTFGFMDGLVRSGAAAAGVSILASRLLGLHKVMQNAPSWQMNMLKFGGAIQAVIGGMGFISWLSRGRINIGLFTKGIASLTTKFGDLSDKISGFGKFFSFVFNTNGKVISGFASALDGLGKGMMKVFDSSTTLGRGLQNLAKGSLNTIMGFNLMKMGFNGLTERFKNLGWAGKLVMASLAGIATVGPAAMEVLGKALVGTSNLLVGLLDGIKQLSGGFLALPGAISMVLATVSTLGVGFKGLKDQFKDIFQTDDPAKAAIALAKLPPHLKGIGQALSDLFPKFKDLQKTVQTELFAGLETQIKSLAGSYLPILEKGMTTVAHSIRGAKDELYNFMMQGKTQADTSTIYNLTAQAINNIARAIKPAAEGLRDIAVVGAQFLAQMTGGLPGLVQKFASFAAVNRQNGNLMKWMQDAWDGTKNLVKGLADATKGVWKILTMFASNNGDNFLQRFANAMERFNNAMQKSGADGTLKKIGDYIRNLGTEHIQRVSDVLRSLMDTGKAAAPVIQDIAHYASKFLVPAMKFAAQVLETFFDIIDALHLGPLLGVLTGIATGFALIYKVVAPIKNLIQMVVGGFMLLRGAGELVKGFGAIIATLGPSSLKGAEGIGKMTAAVKGLGTAVGIATAVWAAFSQHNQYMQDASKALDDSLQKNKDSFQDLLRVFASAKTGGESDVLSKINENTKNKFDELQGIADQAPSIWQHILNGLSGPGMGKKSGADGGFFSGWGQSEDFNRIQAITDKAKAAISGFKELGASQELINKAVASGGPAYNQLYNDLVKAGEQTGVFGEHARAAAEQLKAWRAEVEKAARDAATLGAGGMQVVDGIKQIGDAAGNSTEKLNGLKSILEGLGIIKTSAMQAAADYAQGLLDLSSAAEKIIVPGDNLNNIYDAQAGKLNLTTQSAINLSNTLTSLAQQYQNAITNGTDATKAYADFQTRVDGLTDSINNAAGGIVITKEQMRQLAQEAGTFDPTQLQNKLNAFLNDPEKKKILLEAGINEDSLKKIQQQMQGAFNGVSMTEQNGLHGGYADRARAAEKANKDKSMEDFKAYVKDLTDTLDESSGKAKDAGSKFAQAFSEGLSSNDAAIKAAEEMAREIKARFHASPPKKGPLSTNGDAAVYGGKMFAKSYAEGLAAATGQVAGAANNMAGAVSTGANVAMGDGKKPGDKAGKYFQDLLALTAFANQFSSTVQKITETLFRSLKFASDPLGKGTFFGQNLGYKKTVSDAELQRRRDDKAYADYQSVKEQAQRNTNLYDPTTGGLKAPFVVGNLPSDASKNDIQAKIIAEGQRRGMNAQQVQAALAIAQIESGYVANIDGGIQAAPGQVGTEADRVLGLFQQKASWGTADQRRDPNYAINAFLDAYQKQLATTSDPLLAAVLTQNPHLGSGAAKDPYYGKVSGALPQSIKDYFDILKNPPKISPSDMGLQLGAQAPIKGGDSVTYTPQWMMEHGFAPLYTRDAQGNAAIPPWAQQLAQAFNLTAATYNDPGGGLHGGGMGGWAFDFSGNPADMERFAQFLQQNMAGNLAQLIYSGSKEYGIAGGVDVGGPKGQGRYYGYGAQGYPGHGDHVHGAFFTPPGVFPATANMNQVPSFLKPYSGGDTNQVVLQQNPQTGAWEQVTPHGKNAGTQPGDVKPNGQPFTPEEIKALQDAMPLQFTLPDGMTMQQFQDMQSNPNQFAWQTGNEMLTAMAAQSSVIANAQSIKGNPSGYTETQISNVLTGLDSYIQQQKDIDTATSRAQAAQAESLKSSIMDSTGMTQQQNPIDQIAGIASQAFGVASDIIGTITTGIEAIGAGKNIADTLVRGISGTKEVSNVIDNVQKFVELGARIAGSVASVTGLAASVAGAAGAGSAAGDGGGTAAAAAALGSVSTIASLVQAGFETANAVIDLSQEAVKIAGGYVGDFLGYLTGGPNGGPLAGNVKFLLDNQTNQLLTYSANNPLDKRTHNIPFAPHNTESRQQGIGTINVYGGPGSDPRDLTRQMMYQVNSAQYAGALSQ